MGYRDTRSPLARSMGLGSAKAGAGRWWSERLSAVALVPVTLWFVGAIIVHASADYASFIFWMKSPVTATLMIILLIALFRHTALGLQVVIEDYVHSAAKFFWVMMVDIGCFVFATAGVVATIYIALAI